MPTPPINTQDLILGYTLKERIGTGGYGEVWKAEAPGGIQKAIKLIYGYHDENRAQAELKSLNRIKEVRHPFLLSLERIEIVEGRLAVVTELADQSLADRFKECQDEGLDGIPRDELIQYLYDTADALDFISESHRLQHLDIKPENLLLVGNHVKVADFGLVKDIHDATQSLMAGLTPTYAPPELFDGRPSRSSDQYSLAIVYQEMLTGVRPFSGTTAAQLASQHVHADPDVSKLPRGDQQPVRRALSKQPEARFPNCRTLVDELANRQSKKVRREAKRSIKSKPKALADHTRPLSESSLIGSVVAPTVTKLGAVEIDPQQMAVRPTLFIGIGQTATNVMRRLRRRFRDRLGDDDAIPAFQILCIDTDVRDLAAATRSNSVDALTHEETLPVPLRKPEEYRNDARMHLNWLSRRWIYNVPRSLQTEGIRPLGRLAFADHHEKIFERLHDLIEQITLPESIAKTSETVELDPSGEPQVFVVTSIAGGVGSGMVLDMAYAVRTVLLERGLQDESVHGVLAYSSGRSASERDLTVANTLSCLSEMHHYSRVSGYPGDDSCDLPPFDDDRPTFAETYVVDLGNDLRQDEFEAATDNLAEYLYLNAATRCGAFFDACREPASEEDQMTVRTFGLTQTATKDGDIATIPSYILAQRLIRYWMPTEKQRGALDVQAGRDLLQSSGVSLSQILVRFEAVFARHVGLAPKSLIDAKITEVIHRAESVINEHGAEELCSQLESQIDEVLELEVNPRDNRFGHHLDEEPSLAQIVDAEYQSQLGQFSESMFEVILGELDPVGRRLDRARQVYEQVSARLQESIAEGRDLRQRNNGDLSRVVHQLNSADRAPDADEEPVDICALMREYGQLRTRGFVLHCALRVISDLQQYVERVLDHISHILQFSFDMLQLLDKRVQDEQRTALVVDQKDDRLIERLLTKRVTMQVDELCQRVDALLQEGFFTEMGGFRRLVSRETKWENKLEAAVLRASRCVVADVFRRLDLDQMFAEEKIDANQIAQWWQHRLERSTPRLLPKCGGASRLLIAVPNGSSTKALSQCVIDQFQEKPTLLEATNGDVDVCYEVDQMSLPVIASNLISTCPDCAEYVARLHTRTDIQWTPLVRLT